MRKKPGLALFLTAAVLWPIGSPVIASPPSVQDQIDRVIADQGGVQTSWNTVSWNNGQVVLEVSAVQLVSTYASGADSCAAGRYCAFQAANFGGSKLTFSSCPATTTNFSAIGGKVGSLSNRRNTGTVRAFSSSATKSILTPGQSAALLAGITRITCA